MRKIDVVAGYYLSRLATSDKLAAITEAIALSKDLSFRVSNHPDATTPDGVYILLRCKDLITGLEDLKDNFSSLKPEIIYSKARTLWNIAGVIEQQLWELSNSDVLKQLATKIYDLLYNAFTEPKIK